MSASPSELPDDDQVCRQLATDLKAHGFLVEACVGQSHFRVELAVRTAEDAAYRLGILVDSAAQYEQSDALDRDMMRPRLLRTFGWRIAKVLAKDWYSDRQGELARILSLLRGEAEGDDAAAGTNGKEIEEEEKD